MVESPLGADTGFADCMVRTQIVGCQTTYPIGLIALHGEVIKMHKAKKALLAMGVTIRGICVDGIAVPLEDLGKLETYAAEKHPSGKPMFKIKQVPDNNIPRCPQKTVDNSRVWPRQSPMRVITETDDALVMELLRKARVSEAFRCRWDLKRETLQLIAAFADEDDSGFSPQECSYDPFDIRAAIIVYNGGADVIGPPGTGKSTLLKKVYRTWHKLYDGDTVVNAAITHVAARILPDGQTLARLFHKNRYGNVGKLVVQLDESRTVGLAALARLATWGFIGCKFVLYGDDCQFEPIQDAWHGKDEPDIYRQMTRSLRLELSTNRRGLDPNLFKFHLELRPFVRSDGNELSLACQRLRETYPWDGVYPDWGFLCISHRTRIMVNSIVNLDSVKTVPGAILVQKIGHVTGVMSQPQDMWIVPGLELIGVSKKSTSIVNGVRYVVEAANDQTVRVRMLPEYRRDLDARPPTRKTERLEGSITLAHRDASAWLRLTHCLCYASVQGITVRDKHVVLLDILKGHFGIRPVIVAASRVTDGKYLHAATPQAQANMLRRYVAETMGPPVPEVEVREDSESEIDDYED